MPADPDEFWLLRDTGLVTSNAGDSIRLFQAASPHEWDEARRLVREYAASLDVDLSFQNFDEELRHFATEYAPPGGAFILAQETGLSLACIGLRQFSAEIGEIKRLYVIPAARGRRLGRVLVERIIAVARDIGYRSVLLDTLPFMKEAQALYLSLGFRPTTAYRFNPIEGSAFLRLDL
ncbi:MAG TPA: GNAT family N-acetyltransferase [Steroidobacteraceae bacterium]|nr:GNAT family N-acetyltransferase [Steroidobacteraceae bacterium]